MLTGLIFATEEAGSPPDTLIATLPFGGMSLLEYQTRLLIAAGAKHILVAVARMTPALVGAVSRAGQHGVPVDVVRSAEEALAQVHPNARLLVMTDGLVTVEEAVRCMAVAGPEALLVTRDLPSQGVLERIDPQHCWAGMARLSVKRLVEVARMPRDYDFQSLLVRVAAQAGLEQIMLPESWRRSGHSIERNAAALAARSKQVFTGLTERRANWADRWLFTRAARLALPYLVESNVPEAVLVAGGGLVGCFALASLWFGWMVAGFGIALVATLLFAGAGSLAALRGNGRLGSIAEAATGLLTAVMALLLGWRLHEQENLTALVLALAFAATLAIAERATVAARAWWGSPAGWLLLLTGGVLAGHPVAGLALAALYAFVTLAAAVEAGRSPEKPWPEKP